MTPTSDLNMAQPTFQGMRAPAQPTDLNLSEEARSLLTALDNSVRPAALAENYPRIINTVARLWRRPSQMDRYLNELLIDTRGNRKGFPMKILLELTNLKDHYQNDAFPMRGNVWDESAMEKNR